MWPVFWSLLSCDAPSDGDRYVRALTQAGSFEEAVSLCAGIADETAQGDCQLAVMESYERLEEADCASVELALWRDECLFLLAERQAASGSLEQGIATCHRTRFARSCSWHLLREEVRASLDLTAVEAEARLVPFVQSDPLPDAGLQFWRIRWREAASVGRPADEALCDGLKDERSCLAGLEHHIGQTLDALGRSRKQLLCAKELGKRATVGGVPAWVSGPLATASEQRWVRDHCGEWAPTDRP